MLHRSLRDSEAVQREGQYHIFTLPVNRRLTFFSFFLNKFSSKKTRSKTLAQFI
ncbi:hypothetical protein TREVI0001_1978 [Treponema vincentii ATCC 35580]|uniref:Uncharacterized protein n=1 Tax=Treponema vincentii ATCC 35580 TaxID=596324 RepID=C8PPN4_9SPIR|nr:hypothetical protein TREVI0001_1978 [Treponema vincentii ATCC 35580]